MCYGSECGPALSLSRIFVLCDRGQNAYFYDRGRTRNCERGMEGKSVGSAKDLASELNLNANRSHRTSVLEHIDGRVHRLRDEFLA